MVRKVDEQPNPTLKQSFQGRFGQSVGSFSSDKHSASSFTSLKNNFLIAMPGIDAGMFSNSITYICEHDEQGAMGIIINSPLDLSLDEILEHLNIKDGLTVHSEKVLAGGPVQMDRGFVLHRKSEKTWQSTHDVAADISLTTSQDVLADIAHDQGPEDSVVALGYAGWGAGQLEEELVENAWLTVPADSDIIFNTPIEQRATKAAAKLGIDLNLLTTEAGHA